MAQMETDDSINVTDNVVPHWKKNIIPPLKLIPNTMSCCIFKYSAVK